MNEYGFRIKNLIFTYANKLLRFCGRYLFVLFVFFLIGFITGIMTSSRYVSDISCDNLINKYLCAFLKKESKYISFFLILSVYYLIVSLFIIIFTRNRFFVVLNVILLTLLSYIFGFDLCIIVTCLGLSGVILGVVFWGLLGVIVFVTLMIITAIACRRCKDRRSACQSFDNSGYIRMYLLFVVIGLIVLFLMVLLFSIIHIFVIVD